MIASTYDCNVYLMSRFGLAAYVFGAFSQQVSVLLAAINSGVSPFIYIALMPAYKRNFLSTFCSCWSIRDRVVVGECSTNGNHNSETEISFIRMTMNEQERNQRYNTEVM